MSDDDPEGEGDDWTLQAMLGYELRDRIPSGVVDRYIDIVSYQERCSAKDDVRGQSCGVHCMYSPQNKAR